MPKKASPKPAASSGKMQMNMKSNVGVHIINKDSRAAIEAIYDVPPKKGLRLLKKAGILTSTHRLARLYK